MSAWIWNYGFSVEVRGLGFWVGVPRLCDNSSLKPIGFFSYRSKHG